MVITAWLDYDFADTVGDSVEGILLSIALWPFVVVIAVAPIIDPVTLGTKLRNRRKVENSDHGSP